MLNTRPYNKLFNILLELLRGYKEEDEDTEEQDELITQSCNILRYMEQQGYILADTPYPYYFVPVEVPS